MPTRSGKEYKYNSSNIKLDYDKKIIYEIKINFDEASREWRKNKIHLGEGIFKYKRDIGKSFIKLG